MLHSTSVKNEHNSYRLFFLSFFFNLTLCVQQMNMDDFPRGPTRSSGGEQCIFPAVPGLPDSRSFEFGEDFWPRQKVSRQRAWPRCAHVVVSARKLPASLKF